MATSLRQRSWDAYQLRLKRKVPLRVSQAKELAEARVLMERVEARRKVMVKREQGG